MSHDISIIKEPLGRAIHQNININGINTANIQHKISLYDDNANSSISLQDNTYLNEIYSKTFSYSFNCSKFTILPLYTWQPKHYPKPYLLTFKPRGRIYILVLIFGF